jgi:hypothetical protein
MKRIQLVEIMLPANKMVAMFLPQLPVNFISFELSDNRLSLSDMVLLLSSAFAKNYHAT